MALSVDEVARLKKNLIEAKRLKKHYDSFNVTDCYCGESSHSECPEHISGYIASLERVINGNIVSNNKRK